MEKVDDGFSMVEMLVIAVILAVLSGISLTVYLGQKHKAYEAETLQETAIVGRMYTRAFSMGEMPVITPDKVSTSQEETRVDGVVSLTTPPTGGSGYCISFVGNNGVTAHYRDEYGAHLGPCPDISASGPQDASPAPSTAPTGVIAMPVPVNDTASVVAGDTVTVDVLANDTAGSTIDSVVTPPIDGTATVQDNSVVYTAPPTAVGVQPFTYSIVGSPLTATVTVDVLPAPVTGINADTANVLAGEVVHIDVLANDAPGSTLSGIFTKPAKGSAVVDTGMVKFTAPLDYSGKLTFTYSVAGTVEVGTVSVNVMKEPPQLLVVKTLVHGTQYTINVFELASLTRAKLEAVHSPSDASAGRVTSWSQDGTINYTAPSVAPGQKITIEFSYSWNGKTISGNTLTLTVS